MIILPNGVAVIDGDTHHAKWCAQSGLIHDRWMADQICKHIKPGDVVIDGGANIGTLTRAMLDAGAKVVAFEPNALAAECLLANCQHENLEIYSGFALSDFEDDFVRFNYQSNAGAGYCTQGRYDGAKGYLLCYTIDELSLNQCSLIKLDIEGYEAKALRGARETIARFRPILIIEVNAFALERAGDGEGILLSIIEELGYSWRILQDNCKRGDPQYDLEAIPK